MPERIQRRRVAGWLKPVRAVCVSRPSAFGNPFTLADAIEAGLLSPQDPPAVARGFLKRCFEDWLAARCDGDWPWAGPESDRARSAIRCRLWELRGRDLACWCPLDQPCHADVLLDLANREPMP